MFTPPVIAFQIAIAAIILTAAYFGGTVTFIIAVVIAVGWTFSMLFGPLLIIQLGTVALASWAAIHFFFLNPSSEPKNVNTTTNSRTEESLPTIKKSASAEKGEPQATELEKQTSNLPIPVPQYSFNSRPLTIGQKYSLQQLDAIFQFDYKGHAGIKSSSKGDIVLFSNDEQSQYQNVEVGNTILFQGQNTGKDNQKLRYGNKQLYDAFDNPNTTIYLFKNYSYIGQYTVSSKPFLKNGKWFFPISPK